MDDDSNKVGDRIHGVRVLGTRQKLHQIVKKTKPQEVIITIPSAEGRMVHEFVKSLESYNIAVKMVPNLREINNGEVNLSQLRSLTSEDLLERLPVGQDVEPIRRLIKGRRFLVTGAAGSIGSEICRQLAGHSPASLVLVDVNENDSYLLFRELQQSHPGSLLQVEIADIRDRARIERLGRQYCTSMLRLPNQAITDIDNAPTTTAMITNLASFSVFIFYPTSTAIAS